MNYRKIYDSLVAKARWRETTGIVERHHILPRCLGGGNEASNIVRLYPREHYLAHVLLTKIYPDVHGLKLAVIMMSGRCAFTTSRVYATIRKDAMAERSRRLKGKPRPTQHMEKMWETVRSGRPRPKSHCEAISKAKLGSKHTEETRRKISLWGLGRKMPEEIAVKAAKAQSSIPDSVILEMRREYEGGAQMNSISRKYGVSLSLGARIMKRQSYKWVTGEGVRLDQ